jgi:hypothetical protein
MVRLVETQTPVNEWVEKGQNVGKLARPMGNAVKREVGWAKDDA